MAPEKLREEDIAIGQRIKNRRIEIGMTQEELAQRVGYAHKSSIKCSKKATKKLRETTQEIKKRGFRPAFFMPCTT